MKKKAGFTLLELMIVVIIIGLLATMALPTYIKSRQRSCRAEAYAVLAQLRQAEVRYNQEYGAYTATIGNLDVDNPNNVASTRRNFTYTADGGTGAVTATSIATGTARLPAGKTIVLNIDGSKTETSW